MQIHGFSAPNPVSEKLDRKYSFRDLKYSILYHLDSIFIGMKEKDISNLSFIINGVNTCKQTI
ncbi:MAG: hypothetical protein GF411_13070 [Candidatus Lokiarchaeota archaeon]|nr:hypothetical protein [Candidatus Lokiarchaeota archaeon]